MEKRKLSLKKPAIIAGLVLTLMLAAFGGLAATGAHAAPVKTHPGVKAPALAAMHKAAKKTSQCVTNSSKFWVNPCKEHETDTGGISFVIVAHHLIPNAPYIIFAPTLDNACGGTDATSDGQTLGGTGAVETSDFSGNLNVAVIANGCIPRSQAYYVVLQLNQTPYTSETSSILVERP